MKVFADNKIYCNKCGRAMIRNSIGYFEDFLEITKTWGYHSPFDGQTHDMDICVECYSSWVSQFEIPPQIEYSYLQAGEEYA